MGYFFSQFVKSTASDCACMELKRIKRKMVLIEVEVVRGVSGEER